MAWGRCRRWPVTQSVVSGRRPRCGKMAQFSLAWHSSATDHRLLRQHVAEYVDALAWPWDDVAASWHGDGRRHWRMALCAASSRHGCTTQARKASTHTRTHALRRLQRFCCCRPVGTAIHVSAQMFIHIAMHTYTHVYTCLHGIRHRTFLCGPSPTCLCMPHKSTNSCRTCVCIHVHTHVRIHVYKHVHTYD